MSIIKIPMIIPKIIISGKNMNDISLVGRFVILESITLKSIHPNVYPNNIDRGIAIKDTNANIEKKYLFMSDLEYPKPNKIPICCF